MAGIRKQYAANGDLIVNTYEAALEVTTETRLSLGVCGQRCTCLRDLAPLAFGWKGRDPASSKRCPMCGLPLKRMTHYRWDGPIQLLGLTE